MSMFVTLMKKCHNDVERKQLLYYDYRVTDVDNNFKAMLNKDEQKGE